MASFTWHVVGGAKQVGLNELLGRNPPRWILAVVTSPEQTDYIVRWLRTAGLPREPTLSGRQPRELKPCSKRMFYPRIQVRALEVHDDTSVTGQLCYRVNRKSGVTLRALKACVARWGVNDD